MLPVQQSFVAYQEIPALNQSTLKRILVSPLYYQWSLTQPEKDTAALRFGRAADIAAFEPKRYVDEFAIYPPGQPDKSLNRSTKEGKARWAEWLDAHPEDEGMDADAFKLAVFREAHPGMTLLTRDEHERAWKVGEIARTHELTAPYFRGGQVQVTLEWTDKATDLRCKARVDLVSDHGPALVDLKTARTVDAALFGRSVHQFMYHFQGAFYREGWKACHGEWLPFKLAAVESLAPHDAGLFALEGDALCRGNELVRKALDLYARCRDTGKWPGRYRFEETVDLPAYAMSADTDAEPVEDGPITY